MKPIDIVIIVVAALAVIGVVAWQIWKKKTGKGGGGCGCGCEGCTNGSCPSARPKNDNTQN
ncbi:MAG: FeoB-associated Cys-rich membrane protein [Clostridia bacterium]|nr:FeoB-associated Cys-rich membrane protein [Clostridia bacterium]